MNFTSTIPNPIDLIIVLVALSLVPFIVVMVTSYAKIIVVLSLFRNAIGLQNVPPTFALNGLTLILTLFIMAPVIEKSYESLISLKMGSDVKAMLAQMDPVVEPFTEFLRHHSSDEDRAFFSDASAALWKSSSLPPANRDSIFVLIPSFAIGELTRAFEIGFLLFLPFLVIDLVVAGTTAAMGMQMVQPTTIALPLKIFLFVEVGGWRLLLRGLVMSYS